MDAKTRNCLFGFTEDNPSDAAENPEYAEFYQYLKPPEKQKKRKKKINFCPGCKNHDCDNCDL